MTPEEEPRADWKCDCGVCNICIDQYQDLPYRKPPLGVMPEWRWLELRIDALNDAVIRRHGFDALSQDWLAEAERHRKRFVELRRERALTESPTYCKKCGLGTEGECC